MAGTTRNRLIQAAAVCVVLLFAAEGVARFAVPPLAAADALYDHRSLMVQARAPRDGAPVIWWIGDSTVLGLDVGRDHTPGVLLERARETPYEVRTVAVPGIGLDNTRELLADLPLRPGDRVLVSVHPGLIDDYRDIGYAAAKGPWQSRAEHGAARVFRPLALVRHQDYLKRLPILIAQAALPERFTYALRRTRPGPQRLADWSHGELGERELRSLRGRYGTITAAAAESAARKLGAIAEDLSGEGIEVHAYVAPLNRIIMDRYGYAEWSTIVEVAAETCASAPVPCADLVAAVPGELFYDDDHLTREGYRVFVERLVEETATAR